MELAAGGVACHSECESCTMATSLDFACSRGCNNSKQVQQHQATMPHSHTCIHYYNKPTHLCQAQRLQLLRHPPTQGGWQVGLVKRRPLQPLRPARKQWECGVWLPQWQLPPGRVDDQGGVDRNGGQRWDGKGGVAAGKHKERDPEQQDEAHEDAGALQEFDVERLPAAEGVPAAVFVVDCHKEERNGDVLQRKPIVQTQRGGRACPTRSGLAM